eukprot:Seg468.6 transcript_id=Seg468.6/GoldUCD/mRNA.D3Y31 product="Beta-2 adrenergic receptor" protein_id=Seg468.6/GoldUCD/D3Y31
MAGFTATMATALLNISTAVATNLTSNCTNCTKATLGIGSSPCNGYTTDPGQIAYAVFLSLVMLLSILGNLLVVIAIALSPRLRENPTNYFIASLSVSDLCYALFQSPIRISQILRNRAFCFGPSVCQMFVITDIITSPATISTLFVIAIDRFFCITKPFIYQERMSRSMAKVIICFVWLYACVWAGISVFNWEEPFKPTIQVTSVKVCFNANPVFYLTSYFVVTLIPLVVMGVLYVIILQIAITQIRAIRATEVHLPQQNQDENQNGGKKGKGSKRSRRTNREFKATATLAIVYGAFFVCWMPLLVINIVAQFSPDSFTSLRSNKTLFDFVYYTFVEILPTISTAINPFIYSVFNRQFRAAFMAVMLRLIRRYDVLRRTTIVNELEISRTDAGRTVVSTTR